MDSNKIEVRCPNCNQLLEIPTGLERFSCLYCGASLTLAELTEPVPEGDYEAAMEFVHAHLMDCIRNYPDYDRKITKKDYVPSFETYERGTSDLFTQLDLACRLRPEARTELLRNTVEEFLDGLQAYFEADKRWKHSARRNDVIFETKIVIALFMVPAVRHLGLSIGEDFSEELHAQWSRRYPKSPYQPGTYEDISSGFSRRRFCFITTAVCQEEGKPDDCAELTAFRAFRDGYLSRCPDGPALIAEYYDIAPAIVACIDYCDDSAAAYRAIRRTYLADCYADLCAGRLEQCKQRYIRMVRTLEKKYLS